MTNLTDYICINHHLMTIKEMSEETGAKDDRIRKICTKNGWTPLAPVDRVKDYIMSHPGAVLQDVAEKFDIQVAYVKTLANGLGIDLVARGTTTTKNQSNGIHYSLMHRAFNTPDPEGVIEDLAILLREPGKVKRIREAYNQSGSPYGIADSLNK